MMFSFKQIPVAYYAVLEDDWAYLELGEIGTGVPAVESDTGAVVETNTGWTYGEQSVYGDWEGR